MAQSKKIRNSNWTLGWFVGMRRLRRHESVALWNLQLFFAPALPMTAIASNGGSEIRSQKQSIRVKIEKDERFDSEVLSKILWFARESNYNRGFVARIRRWEQRTTTHETTWTVLVGGLVLRLGLLHSGEHWIGALYSPNDDGGFWWFYGRREKKRRKRGKRNSSVP